MIHQHTLTRGPRYAGEGDHEFYANADNGPRISTYFLSDEDWQAMGCPDEVVLTVTPAADAATASEALAKAWDEGYDIGYEDQRYRDTTKPMPPNPYAPEEPS